MAMPTERISAADFRAMQGRPRQGAKKAPPEASGGIRGAPVKALPVREGECIIHVYMADGASHIADVEQGCRFLRQAAADRHVAEIHLKYAEGRP
jgi:hypothetical protein